MHICKQLHPDQRIRHIFNTHLYPFVTYAQDLDLSHASYLIPTEGVSVHLDLLLG